MNRGTICGVDCAECYMKESCKGCMATEGHPFGGECVLARHCQRQGINRQPDCEAAISEYKVKLMQEINSIGITDMPEIIELFSLKGSFINLEYECSNGNKLKFWKDNDIYLGTQIPKTDSDRYYGVTADDNYILICEYGEDAADPEIILYKKR